MFEEGLPLATTTKDVLSVYDEQGFVHFSAKDTGALISDFYKELTVITRLQCRALESEKKPPLDSSLEELLMFLVAEHRPTIGAIYEASQTLPSLYAMHNHAIMRTLLEKFSFVHPNLMDIPRVQIQMPNEDQFNVTPHQESNFYDAPESSLNIWIGLFDTDQDMGPLTVYPGTHKLGVLEMQNPMGENAFTFVDSSWENSFEERRVAVRAGSVIVFSNHLIHGSSPNRSDRPKISMQLRYNSLEDPLYLAGGWKRTYRVVERYQNLK